MQNYNVLSCKQDIGLRVTRLHKEELLAVGIMDTGTKEELEETIKWYSENFNHGLHVITYAERLAQNPLQSKFTDVTFIVFDKAPVLGERINALANECMTTYFYLTRTDIETVAFDWKSITEKFAHEEHIAVLTPLVFNRNKELMPSVSAPHIEKKIPDILSFKPSRKDDQNLYPFLGLGVYDRALFQRLRGFDEEIKSAYYQVLDFGTRCWLYGYSIFSVNYMAIIFPEKQNLIEDRSDYPGVDRFFTKALSVTISKNGEPKVKKTYRADKKVLKNEVRPKAALYKTDFQTLCAFWKITEEDS